MDMDEMSNEAKTTTETSGSSNSVLHLTKRFKPTAVKTSNPALSNTDTTKKYKGVVLQNNGRWGAQIYAPQKRIWLGTFDSDEEAASAYDSASIYLRTNPQLNLPLSDMTKHEPDFQESCKKEQVDVLKMIKEGSYKHKFRNFLDLRSQIVASINNVGSKQVRGGGGDQESNKCLLFLFQKELTPSDVGKLNRLVIPKKSAVKYLPSISEKETKDVDVVFYDRATRTEWEFRYCYWRSSQSYVFTKGWNGFVKKKNLKEKDIIVFYTCHVPNNVKTLEGQSKNFLMIDVHYFSNNGFAIPREVNKTVHDSSDEDMKTEDLFSSKLGDEETKSEENRKGFKLFGVRIQ